MGRAVCFCRFPACVEALLKASSVLSQAEAINRIVNIINISAAVCGEFKPVSDRKIRFVFVLGGDTDKVIDQSNIVLGGLL